MANNSIALEVKPPDVVGAYSTGVNTAQVQQSNALKIQGQQQDLAQGVDKAKMDAAEHVMQMIGSGAMYAMGGKLDGQVDPAKFNEVLDGLGTMGVPKDEIDKFRGHPELAPIAARSSMTTLQQLGMAKSDRDYQMALDKFNNDLAGGTPTGYRQNATGMEAVPGGPADPNNPLNNTKIKGATSGAESDGNAKAIAGAIISGDQPPDVKGLYKYSGAVRAELAKQGFDLSTANEDWTATQKHLASLNGPQQLRLRQAVDFASSSLDLVDSLATEWKGGQFPLLNAANLKLAKEGAYGQKAASLATRLGASVADLTSELATVYKGGNSSTDETLRLAAQNLNESWSTDTIKDGTDQIRKTLTYRKNSLKSVGVAGTPGNYDPGKPDASAVPPAGAAPASAEVTSKEQYDALPPGSVFTSGGKQYSKPGAAK